jgi:hypothetical protein
MVVPTFVCPTLATPVCAFIHDMFLGLANSLHASSLMVSTTLTSASTLSLKVPRLCHRHCIRRILVLPLLGASLRQRFLCGYLNIGNLNFIIVDLGYLKHSFRDHGYNSPSLLATSTLAQRANTLLEHSSHNVCVAPVGDMG